MGIVGPRGWAGLLLALSVVVVVVSHLLLRRRKQPAPEARPLEAFDQLATELAESAETGKAMHIALGSGGMTGEDAMASLAALQIVSGLADNAASFRVPVIVSVGDPTLLPMAQDALRRAYERQGLAELYRPEWVRFVAPSPVAYAAGAALAGADPVVATNVVAGSMGTEATLITDAGIRRGIRQTGVAVTPGAAEVLYPATGRLAIGEEAFAAGAALTGERRYLAGLLTQDVLRAALIVAMLVATVVALVR